MPNGTAAETCVLGNRNETKIEGVQAELIKETETREKVDTQIWEVVNSLRNHVPPWASLLLTGLAATAGIILGAALTAVLT